jgi:hypothetical protein
LWERLQPRLDALERAVRLRRQFHGDGIARSDGPAGDDNAVNDGIARYAADLRAAEYLRVHSTPTGKLSRPVLAIQTTYDQLVPAWLTNMYQTLAEQSGNPELFVQQYVKRDGHCNIPAADVARGFAQLREWKSSGKRPAPGLTAERP